MDKLKDVEVICHYSTEGKITPLRVKLVDDDGQRQAFVIKEYRDLSGQGARSIYMSRLRSDSALEHRGTMYSTWSFSPPAGH